MSQDEVEWEIGDLFTPKENLSPFYTKGRKYGVLDVSRNCVRFIADDGVKTWEDKRLLIKANKQGDAKKTDEKMNTKQEEQIEWKVGDEFEFKAEQEGFTTMWGFSLDKTYTVLNVNGNLYQPAVRAKNDNGSVYPARFYRIQKPTRNVQMKEKGQSEVLQGVAKVVSPKMAEIEDLLSFLNISQKAKTKLLGLFQDEIMNVRQQALEDFKRKIQDVVG